MGGGVGGREEESLFSFNVALHPQRPKDVHLDFHEAPDLRLLFVCLFACCLFLKQFGFLRKNVTGLVSVASLQVIVGVETVHAPHGVFQIRVQNGAAHETP